MMAIVSVIFLPFSALKIPARAKIISSGMGKPSPQNTRTAKSNHSEKSEVCRSEKIVFNILNYCHYNDATADCEKKYKI
jgi:hypothetical protein